MESASQYGAHSGPCGRRGSFGNGMKATLLSGCRGLAHCTTRTMAPKEKRPQLVFGLWPLILRAGGETSARLCSPAARASHPVCRRYKDGQRRRLSLCSVAKSDQNGCKQHEHSKQHPILSSTRDGKDPSQHMILRRCRPCGFLIPSALTLADPQPIIRLLTDDWRRGVAWCFSPDLTFDRTLKSNVNVFVNPFRCIGRLITNRA